MSTGFDAIGSGAIGELSGDQSDVLIFTPAPDPIMVTKADPFVTAGKSVAPTFKTVTVITFAPSIRAGTRIVVPATNVAITSDPISVQISATVTVPNAPVAVSKYDPAIFTGKIITLPAAPSIAVTKVSPFITAGKAEFPATANITVTPNPPKISISANIFVPNAPVVVTADKPQILGGNYIEANSTITMNTPYGEIGSSSIGEFAIGEGEVSSRIVKVPPIVVLTLVAPQVLAGKTQKPPVVNINVVSSRAEIDSRGRKLRVLAIAS